MNASSLRPKKALVILLLIAGFSANVLMQKSGTDAVVEASAAPDSHPLQVNEVTARDAQVLSAAGAIIIDVRDRAASGSAHLPGALLIPLETLLAQLEKREIAKTADIIVYCGDGSTLGPRAAHMLTQAGYTKVANLKAGLQGWEAAGLPVERS